MCSCGETKLHTVAKTILLDGLHVEKWRHGERFYIATWHESLHHGGLKREVAEAIWHLVPLCENYVEVQGLVTKARSLARKRKLHELRLEG